MKNWTKLEKRLWLFSAFAAGLYLCGFDSQAMHIMEGYLPCLLYTSDVYKRQTIGWPSLTDTR